MSVLLTLFPGVVSYAQITQTTVVEHFTNSNCSICASQNPGIYSALNNHPNVLHMTFHPSAPYASCVFSMSNPVENDARTTYYSIYGSTPKLVVNGVLTTTANLGTSLNNSASALSNFEVKATQEFLTIDSVRVRITIKKVAADTTTVALLFAAVKQDTIFQSTGNGETIHQDVFRKGLTSMNGNTIILPTGVNDSITETFAYKIALNWIPGRLQTIAILQQMNRQVINAAESINITPSPTSLSESDIEQLFVYPNPTKDFIHVPWDEQAATYQIFSINGEIIMTGSLMNHRIPVSHLSNGTYLLQLFSPQQRSTAQIQIKK